MSKRTAVIDGANIAFIEKSQKGDPKGFTQKYPWLKNRHVSAMIIQGRAEIYEPEVE